MNNVQKILSVVNENINSIIINDVNNSSSLCNSIQLVGTDNLSLTGCNIVISQDTQTSCDISKISSLSNKQNIISTITQAIDMSTKTTNKEVAELLATGIVDNDMKITLAQHIKNLIKTEFKEQMFSECLNSVTAEQVQNIKEFKCTGDGRTDNFFVQHLQIYQMTTCITSKVSNILINDSVINDIKIESETTTNITLKGLSKEFGLYILIVVILLIAVFFIGFLIKTMKVGSIKTQTT